tara:strand:+ start:524 stop:733 length:210 start_codon:yes stop_codon:yes gene_type:complete
MAILNDSVIFHGLLFLLSTLLLLFSLKIFEKHINNQKIKKTLRFVIYIAYLGIIIFIFDSHTSHYLDSL